MIVGSCRPLELGKVYAETPHPQLDTRWNNQPYVPLRTASYEEWRAQGAEHGGWTEQVLKDFYGVDKLYYYEVSTD